MAEVAIMACDLAEVIGSAVALKLLFGLPLWAGVLITGEAPGPRAPAERAAPAAEAAGA
jgi:hypothetical protein